MSEKARKEGRRLSKNQRLSEHFSIRCCPPFTFLNSTREIVDRKYSICKSGCFYQKKEEDWICCACQRTRWGPAAPRPAPWPPAPSPKGLRTPSCPLPKGSARPAPTLSPKGLRAPPPTVPLGSAF